jgi:hypothetical protein
MQLSYRRGVHFPEIRMADTSQIREHMDVIRHSALATRTSVDLSRLGGSAGK